MNTSYIVTVSPKGQITIPSAERKKVRHRKFLLEVKDKVFILKPIEIKIIGEETDDLHDFSSLAEPSFEFWNNKEDDIYQEFYSKI